MMKKFITLALIIGTTTFIQAQSNLVFNQVLNFNIGTGEPVTVPEGKVWKLESGISQGNVLISSINQEYGNNLDSSNMDAYSLQAYNMPMWLGQGTTLTLIYNGSTGDNFLSILEFNVVPLSSSSSSSTSSTGFTSSTDFVGSGQYTTTNDYTVADSFTDIDGNEYGAINLNGNIWSSSDLKVTKFTDGTPIPLSTSYTDFRNTSKAAYFINNGTYLYNWQAIVGEHDGNGNTELKKLAPEGYRIPSKADWSILTDFYGGEMFAAHYLMSKTSWPGGKNGINKSGLNLKNISAYAKNGLSSTTTSFSLAWATKSLYYRPSNKYQLFWAFTLAINNGASNGYETKLSEIFATYSSTLGVVTGYEQNSGVAVRVIKEY
jgi:uncharacterized protein (TIGR02145 family)